MAEENTQPQHIQQYQELQDKIQNLSVIVGRSQLSAKLGQQYGGDRDIYQSLGYKKILVFNDYYSRYRRQDIAKAIIDRPISGTWRGALGVLESDDDQETPFEAAWKELSTRLSLKSKFARVDKLTGLGKYGVLLLGFDDVAVPADFRNEVQGQNRKLLYVKPFSEHSAEIQQYETRTNNERYGLPILYRIEMHNPGIETSTTLFVHHSRIIHIPGELLEGEVEGIPRLEAVYNRLTDLEKLIGGSAEMFWRGARPGYQGKVDNEYQMSEEDVDKLQDQVDEFEHNLRRMLVNRGVSLTALEQQVADPKNHVAVQIEMISAITGIPKRVLTGSERGELSSTEDKNNWLDLLQERRDELAEPGIVRPFINRCIETGVLPAPTQLNGEYSVVWDDLWAQSDKEKAEVGKTRSESLKAYGSAATNQDIIPPDAFYSYFLGLSDDEIEQINEMRDSAIQEEADDFDIDLDEE